MRRLASGLMLGAGLLAVGGILDRAAAQRDEGLPPGLCSTLSELRYGYLVFFDAGSGTLTDRAREVIREVAVARSQFGARLIVVRAHVDGVEARDSPDLDQRRAAVVRGELLAQGVAAAAVASVAEGASRMLIVTDAAEPQNRYVTLTLDDLALRGAIPGLLACGKWVRATCLTPGATGSPAACDAALRFLDGETP